MYAIIEDSGTQIKVSQGDVIDVDLRDVQEGAKSLTFDRVLMVNDGEGKSAPRVGTPYLNGASVTAELLEQVRGPKIEVVKFRNRTGYKRKYGHRQSTLRVKITGING
jgi:large subunit ribosomal protein L21